MFTSRQQFLLMLLGLVMNTAKDVKGDDKPTHTPDRPSATGETSWIRRLGGHQGELTNGRFNVVFIGDSLTEFWTHTGKTTWEGELVPLKSMNCGLAGDRTEHILYRINWLDFRRAAPKVFVLLMGTNNLGMTPPDDPKSVARAIVLATNILAKRHPQTRILVLEIPPSGYEPRSALRRSIRETNTLLTQAALPSQAQLVPIYDLFTNPDDQWKPEMTLDGTHFSAMGYEELTKQLAPRLKEIVNSK